MAALSYEVPEEKIAAFTQKVLEAHPDLEEKYVRVL
jgi:hypothetical protein